MIIGVSTPRGKDLGAAPRLVVRKPILAKKCYTEIIEGILSTFTKCGDFYQRCPPRRKESKKSNFQESEREACNFFPLT